MKKKVYLAVLAMCMALTVTACTSSDGSQESSTSQAGEQETEETGTAEADGDEDEKKTDTDTSSSTRLVSVDSVDKYVTIGEYKGLTLDKTVEEVTEDAIDAQIEANLKDAAETVSDGGVQMGDMAVINYVGTKDGETFDGGTANNYELTVGDGSLIIDGFEEGLVGMEKGETRDLNLTFPEDYFEADLAGQDVVFKVTLQSFSRAPELTDEWVAANTDFTTVDEYREDIKKQLEESAVKNAESSLLYTAWTTVEGSSEVKEYPQEDIDDAIAAYKAQVELYAQQADMDTEEFIESQGISMENYETQAQQYAEAKVKQNLIVQGIMDAEGMTLEDKESLAIQEQLIEDAGVKDLATLIDQYGQVAVDESIGLLRVEQFIVDNAEVSQKVSDGDLVGVSGDGGDSMAGIENEEIEEDEIADEDAAGEDTGDSAVAEENIEDDSVEE